MRNRLKGATDTRAEIREGLQAILAALIGRAARGGRHPQLSEAGADLGRIVSHAARVRLAIRETDSGGEDRDFAAGLVRELGARVVLARTPMAPSGGKAPAAFEHAFLLAQLGPLMKHVRDRGGDPDQPGGWQWADALPMGRLAVAPGESVTLVAARPDPSSPGRGIGLALLGRRPGDGRGPPPAPVISFTLIVPYYRQEETGPSLPHAYTLQVEVA